MKNADALIQPLEHAHFRIVALDYALGRKLLHENLDSEAFQAIAALAERLQDNVIAVAVDDDARAADQLRYRPPGRPRSFRPPNRGRQRPGEFAR